ncbi:unnamed protein product, partial [Nesidiocoris tenuis]
MYPDRDMTYLSNVNNQLTSKLAAWRAPASWYHYKSELTPGLLVDQRFAQTSVPLRSPACSELRPSSSSKRGQIGTRPGRQETRVRLRTVPHFGHYEKRQHPAKL